MNQSALERKQKSELHKNHRNRMKTQFINGDGTNFSDHQYLEMLLFFSIPRRDTNELAHILLNEFGSFHGVFDAPMSELVRVKGIGPATATLIHLIAAIFRRYEESKIKGLKKINSRESAINFLKPIFKTGKYEKLVVVYMDGDGCILKVYESTQNFTDIVKIDIKSIIKEANLTDAKSILIAHSHPTTFSKPSRDDKEITIKLAEECDKNNILLCDHIIFGLDKPTALSKMKDLEKIFVF